jgi:hypothetical protein
MMRRYPHLVAEPVVLDAESVRLELPSGAHCVIHGNGSGIAEVLRRCDGATGWGVVVADLETAVNTNPHQSDRLLSALEHHGFIRCVSPTRQFTVALIGNGETAARTATELVAIPNLEILFVQPLPVLHLNRRTTRHHGGNARTLIGHWSDLGESSADLVVVCPPTTQPDHAIIDHLLRHGLRHLTVTASVNQAVVGPLFDGTGCCPNCIDLHRADLDPQWPAVSHRLSTVLTTPNPLLSQWAAVTAGVHVQWLATGASNQLRSKTLSVTPEQPGVQRRLWLPHPDCPCAWAPDAGLANRVQPSLAA